MSESADRHPPLAALLSALAPGLGQLYSGEAKRGFAAHVLLWVAFALWAILSVWTDSAALRLSSFSLLIILWAAILIDAIRLARRSPRPYPLRRYNRPLVYVGVALFVALALQPALSSQVKAHILRAYVIPGDTMSPTLLAGEYLYATPCRAEDVDRGSIVVFRENEIDYIQRAIGLPGDTIEMREKKVRVNGVELDESYVRHIDPQSDPRDPMMDWQAEYASGRGGQTQAPTRDTWGPIAIPAGKLLLLGDNRDNSFDGRYRGLVSEEQIVARASWVYFSRDSSTGMIRWPRIGSSIR